MLVRMQEYSVSENLSALFMRRFIELIKNNSSIDDAFLNLMVLHKREVLSCQWALESGSTRFDCLISTTKNSDKLSKSVKPLSWIISSEDYLVLARLMSLFKNSGLSIVETLEPIILAMESDSLSFTQAYYDVYFHAESRSMQVWIREMTQNS